MSELTVPGGATRFPPNEWTGDEIREIPADTEQPSLIHGTVEALGRSAVDTSGFVGSDNRDGRNLPEPDGGFDPESEDLFVTETNRADTGAKSDAAKPTETNPLHFDKAKVTVWLPSERTRVAEQVIEDGQRLEGSLKESDLHPDVHSLAREVKRLVANPLVADVKDGVASIPSSQKETNRLVIVPALRGETSITLNADIRHPTAERMARMSALQDVPEETVRDTVRRANIGPSVEPLAPNARAITAVGEHWHRVLDNHPKMLHIVTRPVVIISPDTDPPALIHDVAHVPDFNRTVWPNGKPPQEAFRENLSWMELRGYHFGATSAKGTSFTPPDIRVEEIRLATTTTEAAFTPTRLTFTELAKLVQDWPNDQLPEWLRWIREQSLRGQPFRSSITQITV